MKRDRLGKDVLMVGDKKKGEMFGVYWSPKLTSKNCTLPQDTQ